MKGPRKRYFLRVVLPAAGAAGALALAGALGGLLVGMRIGDRAGRVRLRAADAVVGFAQAPRGTSDSFMVLRIPEVYASAHKQESAAKKLDEWLSALKKADFQPMLFSEVLAASKRGESLPEKAVVLMVQPGYEETQNVLTPILAKHRCPVLWVTDRRAIDKGDRRFISRVESMEMKFGGSADVGYFAETPAASFILEPAFQNRDLKGLTVYLASGSRDGRTAVNAQENFKTLNRLNVNIQWTGAELVQRLMAEQPLGERTRLTMARLAGRALGVSATPFTPELLMRFDLQASPGARSTSIRWDGTAGQSDIQVELEAQSINGELWTYLRYDRHTGNGVMVGLTPGHVIVRQSEKGVSRRVATFPWPRPAAGAIAVKLALAEDRLGLSVTGLPDKTVALPSAQVSPQGALGLMVSDRISGVAQARGVLLYATPLGKRFRPIRP